MYTEFLIVKLLCVSEEYTDSLKCPRSVVRLFEGRNSY